MGFYPISLLVFNKLVVVVVGNVDKWENMPGYAKIPLLITNIDKCE